MTARKFWKIFSKFFTNYFEKFPFYVLGDFNIELSKVGKSNFVTKQVHDVINSPCKCAIDLPTHITDHSKTLIDHIYVNDFKHSCISSVALLDLSDHFGTFVIMIAKATKSNKTKQYQTRDMSKFDHVPAKLSK